MGDIIVIKDKGEVLDKLRQELIAVINKYKNTFNGYEIIGVLDTVKQDAHQSIKDGD